LLCGQYLTQRKTNINTIRINSVHHTSLITITGTALIPRYLNYSTGLIILSLARFQAPKPLPSPQRSQHEVKQSHHSETPKVLAQLITAPNQPIVVKGWGQEGSLPPVRCTHQSRDTLGAGRGREPGLIA